MVNKTGCQVCARATVATYVCKTCDYLRLCQTCTIGHTLKKGHWIIKCIIEEGAILKSQQLDCFVHKKPFSLFCQTDKQAVCEDCTKSAEPDSSQICQHADHEIENLEQVLTGAETELQRLVGDLEQWEEKIHAAIQYHGGLEEIYIEQRDLFLRKVQADFEAI